MEDAQLIQLMQRHGVKPTANRIVIARALAAAGRPMSMTELETLLETIDKSNVFRTLQAFREAHLVHVLDDTGDGVRYEKRSHNGSLVTVTATFGFTLASLVIQDLQSGHTPLSR